MHPLKNQKKGKKTYNTIRILEHKKKKKGKIVAEKITNKSIPAPVPLQEFRP